MPKTVKTRTFPVVLKTIIDEAVKDGTIVVTDEKKIRAKLRTAFPDHIKNTTWQAFNQKELDAIRCVIDPVYAERLAAARKRKPRAKTKAVAVKPEPEVTSE